MSARCLMQSRWYIKSSAEMGIKMKKIAFIIMAAALLGNLSGCNNSGNNNGTQEVTGQETVNSPEQSTELNDDQIQEGLMPEGESEEPGQPGGAVGQVHQAVREAYGEMYVPGMAFDEQGLEELFGIGPELYDSFVAEGPVISTQVELFIGVQAREGKGEAVEALLNQYKRELQEGGMQYPMNLPKIEAAQVVRHGDDVYFVMLGAPTMEAEEKGEDAALESAIENNQIGIDVINDFYS